jgi:hypothetical protein
MSSLSKQLAFYSSQTNPMCFGYIYAGIYVDMSRTTMVKFCTMGKGTIVREEEETFISCLLTMTDRLFFSCISPSIYCLGKLLVDSGCVWSHENLYQFPFSRVRDGVCLYTCNNDFLYSWLDANFSPLRFLCRQPCHPILLSLFIMIGKYVLLSYSRCFASWVPVSWNT